MIGLIDHQWCYCFEVALKPNPVKGLKARPLFDIDPSGLVSFLWSLIFDLLQLDILSSKAERKTS